MERPRGSRSRHGRAPRRSGRGWPGPRASEIGKRGQPLTWRQWMWTPSSSLSALRSSSRPDLVVERRMAHRAEPHDDRAVSVDRERRLAATRLGLDVDREHQLGLGGDAVRREAREDLRRDAGRGRELALLVLGPGHERLDDAPRRRPVAPADLDRERLLVPGVGRRLRGQREVQDERQRGPTARPRRLTRRPRAPSPGPRGRARRRGGRAPRRPRSRCARTRPPPHGQSAARAGGSATTAFASTRPSASDGVEQRLGPREVSRSVELCVTLKSPPRITRAPSGESNSGQEVRHDAVHRDQRGAVEHAVDADERDRLDARDRHARDGTMPRPPLPACTLIVASSTNFMGTAG